MKPVWREGNSVRLLENGEEFYPHVHEAIEAAIRSIYIETFILADDCVGQELADVLRAASERGVEVDVLADGFGSDTLSEEFLARLKSSGVRLNLFEPRPRLFGIRTNLVRRMHRKIVLVDGRIAFIGGINFCIDHLRKAGPKALQDYAVRLEGPVVGDIAQAPVEMLSRAPRRRWWHVWRRTEARGPQYESVGQARIKFVTRDNRRRRVAIEREYRLAFRSAKSEIVLANAYFFPGYRVLRDLRNAARRGVRVRIIVQGKPDMPIVTIVARWLYRYLLNGGVEIHEFCERPLHAKVAVVDGRWSTVGSSNLDPISLSLNLEANVMIDDRAFARTLRTRLQRLMEESCEVVDRSSLPPRSLARTVLGVCVFHFLRRFPRWLAWLPRHRPRVVAPTSEHADSNEAGSSA